MARLSYRLFLSENNHTLILVPVLASLGKAFVVRRKYSYKHVKRHDQYVTLFILVRIPSILFLR